MAKGKRYDGQPKLNIKKVIAVALVPVVIIMLVILAIRFSKDKEKKAETKNVAITYKTVFTNGKWGVINSKAETVISPTYDNMIIIPDEAKALFVCQENVDLEREQFTSFAINDKSEKQFTSYDNIETIENLDDDGKLFYFDNTLIASKNGKYGLINFNGKELLPTDYDSIEPIKYLKNSLVTTKDEKKGLVDNSGNVIIENKYEQIEALTDKYENGYIVKDNSGKYGLINYNKKQILECKYNEIKHVAGNDKYVVKQDNELNLIDADGNILLINKFEDVVSIDNENLIIKNENNYGVMNTEGETKIEPKYEYLKYLFDGNYIARKDGKYGIIDINDKTILDFQYYNISYMSEEGFIEAEDIDGKTNIMNNKFEIKCKGIISEINSKYDYIKLRENGEYKYYNFKLEEKTAQDVFPANTLFLSKENGKYGFVNKKGIVVVNYIYDDATEQNDYGYAAVKKDGKWGAIDSKGEVVLEPQNKLELNTLISYIGKWHIAPDLNANYYTDVNE